MAENRRKTRMYEPWGYQEENNYESSEIIMENDLDGFFSDVSYNKDDNKIHFSNKDGEEVASLDVSEFETSDKIIEKAWYEDGKIYIKFTNGDLVTIDVEELIDENEFKGGLQVNDGVVTILIDSESESFLTTSDNGLKLSGVQAAIDVEKERAMGEEQRIEEKVDSEIARATSAETGLQEAINAEVARATSAESKLEDAIESIISGSSPELDALLEKLGYNDNETLVTNNPREVAFGEWNLSHTSAEASGQTAFSIGNGTSDADRSNAIEIMKDGSVYLMIEGELLNINELLGQLAHEIYD